MTRKHIRWQIKLVIAIVMILIGAHAQMQIQYDTGRADLAYEEALK